MNIGGPYEFDSTIQPHPSQCPLAAEDEDVENQKTSVDSENSENQNSEDVEGQKPLEIDVRKRKEMMEDEKWIRREEKKKQQKVWDTFFEKKMEF
ncbi:hypothetical protein B9Z55_004138 [Caenorhabditis nigoni]|uniref:Uncharacterized protein n=1 Tax=Caenorhabditis nigoni TaxID=1611254 RepID=A0A2G5UUZ6_9PELO|nr:hypothetical protein B9Z55_004138 [Caenorhabditis nigoni]